MYVWVDLQLFLCICRLDSEEESECERENELWKKWQTIQSPKKRQNWTAKQTEILKTYPRTNWPFIHPSMSPSNGLAARSALVCVAVVSLLLLLCRVYEGIHIYQIHTHKPRLKNGLDLFHPKYNGTKCLSSTPSRALRLHGLDRIYAVDENGKLKIQKKKRKHHEHTHTWRKTP